MNFQEYMQLEVNSTVIENKINLRNIVNLEDDYEVALLDIIYKHYPNSIKENKYDNSIVGDEVFDIQFTTVLVYYTCAGGGCRFNTFTI